MTKPALPTVIELINRQLEIQRKIESGDKTITLRIGTAYIANLQKIIAGVEIAEQIAEEERQEQEEPPKPTFTSDEILTEESVKSAMKELYSDLEAGKISPQKAMGRLKVLEAMARALRPQMSINQQVGVLVTGPATQAEQKEITERFSKHLANIGERLREQGESIGFAVKELAKYTERTPAECLDAVLARKEIKAGLALKKKSNGQLPH